MRMMKVNDKINKIQVLIYPRRGLQGGSILNLAQVSFMH